jgi:hypothetical protein
MEYSLQSDRWNFPATFYMKTFTSIAGNVIVDVIFIDTVSLTGVIDLIEDRYQNLTGYNMSFPSNVSDLEQLEWIEEMLNSSTGN